MHAKIKKIMAKVFDIPPDSIGEASSSETIERWDSLGHMNLCLALEDEFGVQLDGNRVADIKSYTEVVAAVEDALQK